MGGRALEVYGAQRVDKTLYITLRKEVLQHLGAMCPDYHGFVEIPSYGAKSTFGDLDILYTNPYPDMRQDLIEAFPGPHFSNGNCLSVLYKNLQVDLIYMAPEDYHTAFTYYAYNDLGNLMGKIAHKFGLKYGHKGLTMVLREDDKAEHKFGEIIISKNMSKIFDFLGFDYAVWLEGFHNLDDIFSFVVQSPYFSPELFSFENMNNTARVRDKKRATYNAFLEYIKNLPAGGMDWNKDKSVYIDEIFSFFPEAWGTYKTEVYKFNQYKAIKAKFNGDLVRTWLKDEFENGVVYKLPVVEGKELGDFIKSFIKSIGDTFFDGFNNWVESTPEEQIIKVVVDEYNYWYNCERKKLIVV